MLTVFVSFQGTGLFLTSGKAIARAGPAGALIAYAIMGIVTVGVAYSAGEHSAFMPHTGGFVRHAAKYIEPAMGAAAGWNFCMYSASSPTGWANMEKGREKRDSLITTFHVFVANYRVYHVYYCAYGYQRSGFAGRILE